MNDRLVAGFCGAGESGLSMMSSSPSRHRLLLDGLFRFLTVGKFALAVQNSFCKDNTQGGCCCSSDLWRWAINGLPYDVQELVVIIGVVKEGGVIKQSSHTSTSIRLDQKGLVAGNC